MYPSEAKKNPTGKRSPSALTRMECARLGWPIIQLEHWIMFAKPDKHGRKGTKRDGFGFDHAALDYKPGVLLIQSTSYDHMLDRVKKVLGIPEARFARTLGNRTEVWGWEWWSPGEGTMIPILHKREVVWPSE